MLGRKVAIVGVGYSSFSRGGATAPERLALDACRAAIADAGLTPAGVDAILQYSAGPESPNCHYVQSSLGIPDLAYFMDLSSGPIAVGSVIAASMAVASGTCETALVFRTMTQAIGKTGVIGRARPSRPGDVAAEFMQAVGYGGAMQHAAIGMRQRMSMFGTTAEDYGAIAVNARRWSSQNERAVQRSFITMEDYLSARFVSEPMRLLDCDYPINGASACILTSSERAADLPQTPVSIDAYALATGKAADWFQTPDIMFGAMPECAARLWSRSSFRPADVDVAEIYDGFTHLTMSWIEALGLCPRGEFHHWVDGGRRIGPGGTLPLNTNGGQLAEGRMHGLGLLNEAVLQLRGQCGSRQVTDARVALVSNADGPLPGAMILHT